MLKGLMLTPPVIGRISIGQVVEKNGKRLPQKDDQFTLTSQLQTSDGWLKHPLDEQLRAQDKAGKKLREIPVQLLFSDPDLNLRAEYSFFERDTGRPFCVGNGETCQRRTPSGIETLPCPSPEACEFASGYCKPYGRLNVIVENPSTEGSEDSQDSQDPLGSFIFRTTGFNSIRTLAARLQYFAAISGKRLACLPLALKLRGKSTRQSYGRPIYYVDLTLRSGLSLEETLGIAQAIDEQRQAMGYDQAALDRAAKKGYQQGAFEESSDEAMDVVEEFYPELHAQTITPVTHAQPTQSNGVKAVNGKSTPSRLAQAVQTQVTAQQ
ncbi:hypothetical protein THMIRHAS_04760 [Thiosulfatimonas sediminis]|uniref:Hydrolase or metal-binding protein n=1 Tax=Thiosulfatimonas sediminis TaxID=2675054 RepID=A0A6F8PSJ7_9GAMM|nr:hydrolase or metal-binding protein [Thiosulfatimonas sediminis]BBP45103.1 hypothetical protein THMIRHAS_04760 [Thiosulfatimonas sediminis]